MSTILAKIKRLYNAVEASLALIANQWAYATDTRRIVVMESDGVTKRYYYDSTRLADVTTSYGSALIGTPGITGVTPYGGSSGSSATLQNMLTGLKDYNDNSNCSDGFIPFFSGSPIKLYDSMLEHNASGVSLSYDNDSAGGLFISNPNDLSDAATTVNFTTYGETAHLRHYSPSDINYGLASQLRLSCDKGIIFTLESSYAVKTYFGYSSGDLTSSKLFHTLTNKGIKQENLSITTDANNAIIGHDQSVTITKGDANTRQFFVNKFVTTINTPGNSNTTLDLIHVDTVNTDVTGTTTNLLNIKYGGSDRVKIDSAGHVILSGGSRIVNGSGSPESVVTAAIGSMYMRTDGGAGTSLYIKESGTGNTGWVAK